ncbi:hypothetical protein ACFL6U_27290, partial [Planctomycetota bacterium]
HPSIVMWIPFHEGWGHQRTRQEIMTVGINADTDILQGDIKKWPYDPSGGARYRHRPLIGDG